MSDSSDLPFVKIRVKYRTEKDEGIQRGETGKGPMRTIRLHNPTPDVMSVSFDGSLAMENFTFAESY